MMAVTISRRSGKTGNDDFGLEVTNDADKIAEHLVVRPFGKCVFGAFREAELVVGREELLCMIETARSKQLFGTNDPELFEELRAKEVDAAFTARRRKIGSTNAFNASQPRQQGAVFIVGVGTGMQNTADNVETFQCLRQAHRAAVFGDLRNRDGSLYKEGKKPEEAQKVHELFVLPAVNSFFAFFCLCVFQHLGNCTSISTDR